MITIRPSFFHEQQNFFKNTLLLRESQYHQLTLGDGEPYLKVATTALITCFGYLFIYKTKDNQDKALLYHATGGFPVDIVKIAKLISEEAKLEDVQVIIAMPSESRAQKGKFSNEVVLNIALRGGAIPGQLQPFPGLNKLGFSAKPHLVNNAPFYCIDTLGNHGIQVLLNNEKEKLKSAPCFPHHRAL